MLHACVQRFDVTGNLENFCKILGTKQAHTKHVRCVADTWPDLIMFCSPQAM